jgi:hypothetical protein
VRRNTAYGNTRRIGKALTHDRTTGSRMNQNAKISNLARSVL